MCFVNGDRSLFPSLLAILVYGTSVCCRGISCHLLRRRAIGVPPCVYPPYKAIGARSLVVLTLSRSLAQTGPTKIMSSTNSPKAGSLDARVNAEHAALLESTVRVEATRRATLPSDGDTWQPGDGYKGKANLDAKLDAAFADESGAAKVPASCSSRHGNAPSGSRASVVAANAPPVSSYTPPALRTSLHR